jgi:hypothetical protein
MTIARQAGLPSPRITLAAVLAALLAMTCQVHEGDDPEKLPDGVSEITKEQLLAKVPNFFYFDYNFEPMPGRRLWLRVDDKSFIERYPDGTESRFRILGHAQAHDMPGTVVVKMAGDPEKTLTQNDGSFQVFIPDKGNEVMALLFRHGDGEWSEKGLTLIQKVE